MNEYVALLFITFLSTIVSLVILKIYLLLTVGKCYCNVYLNGKTALITGGNSGLGYETALALAGRGCRVIIADQDDCEESKRNIIAQTGNSNVVTKKFDLTSLQSVRELAKDINNNEERLDFLINNAGVSGTGKVYTKDGLHKGMQINFFGHFLLTHLLIGLLKKSSPSKIIFISSMVAFFHNLSIENLNCPEDQMIIAFTDLKMYANSKLCLIIAANELSKKLRGTGVTAYSVHPGAVYTNIYFRYAKELSYDNLLYKILAPVVIKFFTKSPKEGIQTALHVVLCKDTINNTGKFFSECWVHLPPAAANDPYFAKKIWEASEKLVQLKSDEII
ncbi:hypothetical protein ILUMI_11624 [Ignelater luminosus]|uniref:Uncharacterized protein n=1 Tax=Ignelater luminosus TaxID=2038154 RepID=A0A8K0CVQ2_IGNLU|nr:hypothetical protein ILUMI_11624 [Ignelater luminosus]